MFWNIMMSRDDLCKGLLELILDIKIKKICVPEGQKSIEITNDTRGIRLDVYVNDEAGTVYDLEMQTTNNKNLPKRSRYYQGMIDLKQISQGADLIELKNTVIIFLCTFDVFGKGLPIYTFENSCLQDKNLKLGDETVKIFVNPECDRSGLSEEMNSFLNLLQNKKELTGLAKDISDAIIHAKKHKVWEVEYMTLDMIIREERAEAKAEGHAEGYIAAKMEAVNNMLKAGVAAEVVKEMYPEEYESVIKEYEQV